VYGRATSATGETTGVYGWSQSATGRGVVGLATQGSGANYGVYGESQSSNGKGVYGFANSNSSSAYGVHGESTGGIGVYAEGPTAVFASGETFGIQAQGDALGTGVYSTGQSGVMGLSTSSGGYGGAFFNHTNGEPAVLASGAGTADVDLMLGADADDDGTISSQADQASSDIFMYSNDEFWIYLDQNNNEAGFFQIFNGTGTAIFSVDEAGNVTSSGVQRTAVPAGGDRATGGQVSTYGLQGTEAWLEEVGGAQLVGGEAVVAFDGSFAAAANLEVDYRVFVTPLGDCPLYVAEKAAAAFTVRALGGEACDVGFDYRVLAKPLGQESLRLEPVAPQGDEG
jgi:hypothetical protein